MHLDDNLRRLCIRHVSLTDPDKFPYDIKPEICIAGLNGLTCRLLAVPILRLPRRPIPMIDQLRNRTAWSVPSVSRTQPSGDRKGRVGLHSMEVRLSLHKGAAAYGGWWQFSAVSKWIPCKPRRRSTGVSNFWRQSRAQLELRTQIRSGA